MEKYLEPFANALAKTRKPDLDFIHEFLGFGRCQSNCKVEIWHENGKAVIVLTDTGVGTSVTNASEIILTEIYHKYLGNYPTGSVLFCETYDKVKDGIDVIIPTWTLDNNRKLIVNDVEWKHMGKIVNKHQSFLLNIQSLLIRTVKQTGSFEAQANMPDIEEQLTAEQYQLVNDFFEFLTEKKFTFGSGNYSQRVNQFINNL